MFDSQQVEFTKRCNAAQRCRLLIFSKIPRPGEVKTRLVPAVTEQDACDLAYAFLFDALEDYCALPGIDPWLYLPMESDAPDALERALPELFAEPLRSRLTIRPQRGNDLGERLLAAFEEAFADGNEAVCAIGSDHPTLPVSWVGDAFMQLATDDLVMGPAEDGGYYLIGMRALHAELFLDLPYSTPGLFESVMSISDVSGLDCALLPAWYDVDDAGSLARLRSDRALLRSAGRTSAMLDRLESGTEVVGAQAKGER